MRLTKVKFFLRNSVKGFIYFCVSTGSVILYAGTNGSACPSPGSPSSGYQTQSPSSHSQPSSPEEVTFTEIGALKQQGSTGSPPSPKRVFQFPEIYNNSTAGSNPHSYSHPIAGKRPCGFTGTFTSKCFPFLIPTTHSVSIFFHKRIMSPYYLGHLLCVPLHPDLIFSMFLFLSEQKQEAWCSFVKYVEILHQGSTMVSMHVKAAR